MSSDNPLVLEHVIGGKQLLFAHPSLEDIIIHAVGSVCVVTDLKDIHGQSFLRGHTEDITALAVSENFIATGQLGKRGTREPGAPVCVWRVRDRKLAYKFDSHTIRVTACAFSPDERFLATGGADCAMCVWDLKSGTMVSSFRSDKPITCLAFSMIQPQVPSQSSSSTRSGSGFVRQANPVYRLFAASGTQFRCFDVAFSIASQSYALGRPEPAGLPSTGFVRTYPACAVVNDDVISGTDSGEIVVYSLSNKIYRTHKRACSGSVVSLCRGECTDGKQEVLVGGGHGVIVFFQGMDTEYSIYDVIDLPCNGDVLCLSRIATSTFIALTSRGCVYRIEPSAEYPGKSMPKLIMQTSPSPLSFVSFPPDSSEVFCSGSSGSVTLWDLSTYGTLFTTAMPSDVLSMKLGILPFRASVTGGAAGATGIAPPKGELKQLETIITGHEDGTLRAIEAQGGTPLWKVSAHRGGTTTVDARYGIVLSGGEDGIVRCWSARTQETLAEFRDHTRPVSTVLFDIENTKLAHSCSFDKTIATYDLEQEKKVNVHITTDEIFRCMTQRPDAERELITGAANGIVSVWDCDAPDSVFSFTAGPFAVNALSVSPSGKNLALAGEDGQIYIYDLRTFKIVLPPVSVLHATRPAPKARPPPAIHPPFCSSHGDGHSSSARALAWSPDEKQIVSVGDDSAVFIWNFYD